MRASGDNALKSDARRTSDEASERDDGGAEQATHEGVERAGVTPAVGATGGATRATSCSSNTRCAACSRDTPARHDADDPPARRWRLVARAIGASSSDEPAQAEEDEEDEDAADDDEPAVS